MAGSSAGPDVCSWIMLVATVFRGSCHTLTWPIGVGLKASVEEGKPTPEVQCRQLCLGGSMATAGPLAHVFSVLWGIDLGAELLTHPVILCATFQRAARLLPMAAGPF